MPREIKFRAWNKFKKEWMNEPIIDGANGKMMGFSLLDGSFQRHYSDAEVAIVQYSSLNDENNKEIYEGDILEIKFYSWHMKGKVDTTVKAVVEFEKGCFGVRYGKDNAFTPLSHFNNNVTMEVIGNVFENKELLEVIESGASS